MSTDSAALSVGSGEKVQEREKFISNCWMWAIWTFVRRGGFLILSKSEWGWWPHLMWSPDLHTCQQFEPDHKRLRGRLFPPFVYRGFIKTRRLTGR